MKRIITSLAIVLIAYQVMAIDTLRVANQPKSAKPYVTNLTEVINKTTYPKEMREKSLEGKVMIAIWLDEKGSIVKYQVRESSHERFTKFIEGKVMEFEFMPAKNEFGVPVRSKVNLPFHFTLEI